MSELTVLFFVLAVTGAAVFVVFTAVRVVVDYGGDPTTGLPDTTEWKPGDRIRATSLNTRVPLPPKTYTYHGTVDDGIVLEDASGEWYTHGPDHPRAYTNISRKNRVLEQKLEQNQTTTDDRFPDDPDSRP